MLSSSEWAQELNVLSSAIAKFPEVQEFSEVFFQALFPHISGYDPAMVPKDIKTQLPKFEPTIPRPIIIFRTFAGGDAVLLSYLISLIPDERRVRIQESPLNNVQQLQEVLPTQIDQGEAAFYAKYHKGKVLGRGAFAEVVEAVEKSTGTLWAAKIIDKVKVQKRRKDLNIAERIQAEVEILKKANHPRVVRLHDVLDGQEKIILVLEMVSGGELFDRICQKTKYTESDASTLFHQMVSAIGYLHSIGIVHRDLKPENILLASANSDTDIKLSDFGLSRMVGETGIMSTVCGTTSYMAPEILMRQPYGKAVDMWSLGVILYILLCGYPPFQGSPSNLLKVITTASFTFHTQYWSKVSDPAKDLVKCLLKADPNERYTVEQTLNHPWIRDNVAAQPLPAETIANFRQFSKAFRSGPSDGQGANSDGSEMGLFDGNESDGNSEGLDDMIDDDGM